MSKLGDFLKKQIKEKMEFHKRLASGESVKTLREEIKGNHFYIYGVDYWDNINNGTKKGTLVDLKDIREWISNKGSRYGGTFPPASVIQRKIYAEGTNTPKEDLQIIDKVLKSNKAEIVRLTKDIVLKQLKIK